MSCTVGKRIIGKTKNEADNASAPVAVFLHYLNKVPIIACTLHWRNTQARTTSSSHYPIAFNPNPNPDPNPKVLRELSTKRIGFDKAAFVKTSGELLPVLCQAWDAQWGSIEVLLAAVAAGRVPSGDSEEGVKAAEAMSLGTVCVKVCGCVGGLTSGVADSLWCACAEMRVAVFFLTCSRAVAFSAWCRGKL